jgi:hypothetical protein
MAGSSRVRRIGVAILGVALLLAPAAWSQLGAKGGARPPRTVAHGPGGKTIKSSVVMKRAPKAKMFRLNHGTGEPTLGITKSGAVFITSSDGCVTSCAGSSESVDTVAPGGRVVFKSDNNGKTWTDVSPRVGPAYVQAFSMDPYIYVDEHEDVDRIFDIDLTVACAELSFSDDDGQSWITNPMACGEPVNDHQTLFTGPPVSSPTIEYPYIVYYCFNHPAFTKCSKSLNGGLTFQPTAQIENPECSGLNGHGVTNDKGVVFIPMANCGEPTLAISKDEGDSWEVLKVAGGMRSDSGGDPSVAVDARGTLYYVFVRQDDRLPYLVTSKNSGKTWTKPIMIAPAGVKATNLATLDVGDPGKVAIAYYGTTDEKGVLGWNGYLATGYNVLAKHPVFYSSTVNPPSQPLKIGPCGPGRCGRVLDFIDVEISPDGVPWGAYVDACMTDCEKSKTESIADNDGVVAMFTGGAPLK